MGSFRIGAALPFIAILIAVGVGWHALDAEGDRRVEGIKKRIEVEAKLREDLAEETRERVAENERQINELLITNDRQTRLIIALGREFPQLADDLGLISNGVVRDPGPPHPDRSGGNMEQDPVQPDKRKAAPGTPQPDQPGPTPRDPGPAPAAAEPATAGPPSPPFLPPQPVPPPSPPAPGLVDGIPAAGPILSPLARGLL